MAGILEELNALVDADAAPIPEHIAMSAATLKDLARQLGMTSRADPAEGISTYKGIRITTSEGIPDGEIMVFNSRPIRGAQPSEFIIDEMSTPFDPIVRGEGKVTILDDDGEWKEIGRVADREEVHRAELSDPHYWRTIEEHAASPEMQLNIAELDMPAWVALHGGANADEIGAKLVLEHRVKRTTGGDRYHEVDLHLETKRGTLTERVGWSSGVRWPQPNDWHKALTDLGIIGGR